MSRSHEYYNDRTPMDEYLERVTRMQRTPTMIVDYPHFPEVHKIFDNSVYVKKHSNEAHKKVHFGEHGEDGKREFHEGENIDVEAGGFIQQKHKTFQLCKCDTFKM